MATKEKHRGLKAWPSVAASKTARETAGRLERPPDLQQQEVLHTAFVERHRKIQELAYLKAEKRGFAPGHELEDWLEAEQEVDDASRPLPSY